MDLPTRLINEISRQEHRASVARHVAQKYATGIDHWQEVQEDAKAKIKRLRAELEALRAGRSLHRRIPGQDGA